VAVTTFLALL